MTRLLLSEVFPPVHGGSGRWFWEIYRRLPREQYAVAAGEHPQQTAFDRTHALRLLRLPLHMHAWGLKSWRGLTGYLGLFRRLRQQILTEDISGIHSGRCLPEGFLAYLLSCWTGVPYLVYVHGEDVTTAATSRELSWMVRRVFGRASGLIANSNSTRNILLDEWKIPKERVHLLYPGVDTKKFVPAARDAKTRKELGWGDRPVILTVGRLQKRKGHDRIIEALVAIRRTLPDVLFAFVGDGEEREALQRLIQTHDVANNVQMLGEIDDAKLTRAYQQCDLFALPNRREGADIEGFGMVLLEAQSCGRPVLAGDSGGTAETMRVGETGVIVNCDAVEPLAKTTADLLSNPSRLKQMGEAGRRWVVAHFDWDSLAVQAQTLFDKAGKRR